MTEYCDGKWYVNGNHHSCLKEKGHGDACWCCDDDEFPEFVGGDLSRLLTP